MADDSVKTADPRSTLGFNLREMTEVPPEGGWEPGVLILTYDAWVAEGEALFGPNRADWCFLCPCCGRAQNARTFLAHGVDPKGKVFQSCVGRFIPDAIPPCRFTLNGIIRFPTRVVRFQTEEVPVLEYARAHGRVR